MQVVVIIKARVVIRLPVHLLYILQLDIWFGHGHESWSWLKGHAMVKKGHVAVRFHINRAVKHMAPKMNYAVQSNRLVESKQITAAISTAHFGHVSNGLA